MDEPVEDKDERKKSEDRLSRWLDKLQEDSWQLELIVSGVAIFLLLGAYEHMQALSVRLVVYNMGSNALTGVMSTFWTFAFSSYLVLIGMFLLHLIIRGLWIGAVGLRSVSGDFDHETLDYQPKYDRFLRRRLGRFDDYIETLERNASITFSLAFLLFFAILSVGLFLVVFSLVVLFFTGFDGTFDSTIEFQNGRVLAVIGIVLLVIWTFGMLLLGLLYLVDFLTLGWLKRRKILRNIYYPIYRFFGWITLARFYRPFYYNIIDNRFGKRLVRVYAAIAFTLILLTTFELTNFDNFSYERHSTSVVHPGSYLDTWSTDGSGSSNLLYPSLSSRYAERDYLELFVPSHIRKSEKVLKHKFPDLAPLTASTLSIAGKMRLMEEAAGNPDSTLMALTTIYRVYLNDSLVNNVVWRFYDHPVRKQPGLLYSLPTYDLPRGEHLLRLDRQVVKISDSLAWKQEALISFLR